MTDTWDLWLWITLGLLALVWAASAWGSWYVARRRQHMRNCLREWRAESRCERVGSQQEFYRRAR